MAETGTTTTTTTTILGAGIIGLSTAYYLAQHQPPSTIHLVDPSPDLFASASAFAGGFLARDWFGPAAASLGALGFDEHRRLAAAHDGARRWGYQGTTSLSYDAGGRGPGGGEAQERGEDWLFTGASRASSAAVVVGNQEEGGADLVPRWLQRNEGDSVRLIGDATTTAQLDPARLCRFLLDECRRQGVHVHHPARAVAVLTAAAADAHEQLSGVRIQAGGKEEEEDTTTGATDIPCTRLVIAAGAWSGQVFSELFPGAMTSLPISSLAGHSLLVRSRACTEQDVQEGGCHAIYTNVKPGYSPEMYSRAGGEIWIGGLNSSTLPLPRLPAERKLQLEAIDELRATAAALLGRTSEVTRASLCFRPVTPDGAPIVARVGDEWLGGGVVTRPGGEGGVFVATGHGPWGISQSLGTGMVLAEMAQGRTPLSADVSGLGMRSV